jgi:hypothetical protein
MDMDPEGMPFQVVNKKPCMRRRLKDSKHLRNSNMDLFSWNMNGYRFHIQDLKLL